MAEFRTSPELAKLDGIRHGFFTRQGGVSTGVYASLNAGPGSGDVPALVAENRARIAKAMAVAPDALLSPYQVHSPDVVVVEAPFGTERPKADAIVTNKPGLALGIMTADCGPVLFADAQAGIIGAAHAGWKGAAFGVLDNTLSAMERLGASRSRIVAMLGPTISQPNYEVGTDFKDAVLGANSGAGRFFAPGRADGKFQFDLPGFILSRLESLGTGLARWTGHCTYADEDAFFSYRRTTHRGEPDYGRQLSVIALI